MNMWIRTAAALAVSVMGAAVSVAHASELDQTTAPRAILVRVTTSGQATVYRSDAYATVGEENFERAITETAVNQNVISTFSQMKLGARQSELDFETSTTSWYWWSYGAYWSAGSWFTWNNYRYTWAYPCWYRGAYYYWYW